MNPEAIAAAAKAVWQWWEENCASNSEAVTGEDRSVATSALEAAAPYLIREARAAELEAAAESLDVPEFPDRAYYSSGYRKAMSEAQEVLRARAAAIRDGGK